MKAIFILITIIFISLNLFSQRQGSKLDYNFPTYNEMERKALLLQNKAKETSQHLDKILNDILKQRKNTNDKILDEYLVKWYEHFESYYKMDLASLQVINRIKENERKMKTSLVDYEKQKERKVEQNNYARNNNQNNIGTRQNNASDIESYTTKLDYEKGTSIEVKDNAPVFETPSALAEPVRFVSSNEYVEFIEKSGNKFFAKVRIDKKTYFIHHGQISGISKKEHVEYDDALSPYYSAIFNNNFLKKPNTNSEITYSTRRGDMIAVVKEATEDWNYFLVKTKDGVYGYMPKSSFESIVVENYSSKEYIEHSNNQDDLGKAFTLYQNQEFDTAYDLVSLIISKSNDNSNAAYYLKANIELFHLQNAEQAIADYTIFISHYPNEVSAYYERAIAFEYLSKDREALMDYTNCIKIKPDFLYAYYRRGIVKSGLGDRYGAINDYDFILNCNGPEKENFSDYATVYNNKAYALIKLKRFDEAKPLVEKALDLDQNLSFIWDTRGELNYHMGNFKQCIEDMNKAISLSESANSYYYRGLAKIELNITESGCIDLSKSGELGNFDAYEDINKLCN